MVEIIFGKHYTYGQGLRQRRVKKDISEAWQAHDPLYESQHMIIDTAP